MCKRAYANRARMNIRKEDRCKIPSHIILEAVKAVKIHNLFI